MEHQAKVGLTPKLVLFSLHMLPGCLKSHRWITGVQKLRWMHALKIAQQVTVYQVMLSIKKKLRTYMQDCRWECCSRASLKVWGLQGNNSWAWTHLRKPLGPRSFLKSSEKRWIRGGDKRKAKDCWMMGSLIVSHRFWAVKVGGVRKWSALA